MDLKQFGERMEALSNRYLINTEIAVRKAALVADQRLVNSTPVDTGRARSNWLAGLNAPNRQVVEPDFGDGIRLPVGSANPFDVLSANVQTVNLIVYSRYKNGDVIFISNNVHYIGFLNRGGSRQAPAMFVEMAVLAAISLFKGVRYLK